MRPCNSGRKHDSLVGEQLVRVAQELSEKSFEKIWDNDEDSIYDNND